MKPQKFLIYSLIIACLFLLLSCLKNAPPSCAIISPYDNSVFFQGETFQVEINAEDSDGEINIVKIFIDNILKDSTEIIPYTFMLHASEYNPGYHILEVVAVDNELLETAHEVSIAIEGQYLSGTYHAEYEELDSHGWKSVLEINLTFDIISNVDFDAAVASG